MQKEIYILIGGCFCCLVAKSCYSARVICPWVFPGKNTGLGCHFLPSEMPGDLPNPGVEPMSPTLAGGFFTSVLPEKPLLIGNVCIFAF